MFTHVHTASTLVCSLITAISEMTPRVAKSNAYVPLRIHDCNVWPTDNCSNFAQLLSYELSAYCICLREKQDPHILKGVDLDDMITAMICNVWLSLWGISSRTTKKCSCCLLMIKYYNVNIEWSCIQFALLIPQYDAYLRTSFKLSAGSQIKCHLYHEHKDFPCVWPTIPAQNRFRGSTITSCSALMGPSFGSRHPWASARIGSARDESDVSLCVRPRHLMSTSSLTLKFPWVSSDMARATIRTYPVPTDVTPKACSWM